MKFKVVLWRVSGMRVSAAAGWLEAGTEQNGGCLFNHYWSKRCPLLFPPAAHYLNLSVWNVSGIFGSCGKSSSSPKLVIVHAVIWESLRGLNLNRVFLKQTNRLQSPLNISHVCLCAAWLWREARADLSFTELFIGLWRCRCWWETHPLCWNYKWLWSKRNGRSVRAAKQRFSSIS